MGSGGRTSRLRGTAGPEVSGHHLQLAALYADTDRAELALQELEHVFQLSAVYPLERAVWHEALEVKEELEQKLEREAEREWAAEGSGLTDRVGAAPLANDPPAAGGRQ